ncbi:hypothetical protein ACFO1B_30670 [Dactylosporangium siamense]|uniref:Lipoprotein n=1 Tax=Dactylosporangium siamense TaxID=685454 RepID=A0A919UA43_9ACTN|nr:hypothetical protein [Dactylosporangium siamense]GIG48159.1 hypothetical protein Dsi01nite_062000 [Dactylosporangium siamense]
MRRVLVTLLLGLTVGALTACTASDTSSPASPGASGAAVRTGGCGAPPSAADPERLVDVAGQIGTRGEADFAAVFAGARVGDEGVEVYRKPSAELDAWVKSTFAATCVILHDVRFSAADLAKRYQQVGDDTTYWSEQGVHVNSVSSDFVRGVVVVGTQEVDKAKPLFAARYADGPPVELVDEAPA